MGRPQDTVDIPYKSVSVTEADREQALAERPPESKKAVRDEIPSTKPAFDHFFVDDQGRYWFGRPTSDSDTTAWWMAMPDEQRVHTETLPSKTEILAVKDGQAYGQTTTETGVPTLVRFQIQTAE